MHATIGKIMKKLIISCDLKVEIDEVWNQWLGCKFRILKWLNNLKREERLSEFSEVEVAKSIHISSGVNV